jgi:hypothetical protein
LYMILYNFLYISVSEKFTAFFDHLIEKVILNECVQMCDGNVNKPFDGIFFIVIFLFAQKFIVFKMGRS